METNITKEDLQAVVNLLAEDLILWHKNYNNLSNQLDKLDGKKRLKVRVDSVESIVDSYINRIVNSTKY